MNYDEFKEKIQQDLVETLCEKQVDVTVSFKDVQKLQQESYEGIIVRQKDSATGLTFNFDRFYEHYENGMSYAECLNEISTLVTDNIQDIPQLNGEMFHDYEKLRPLLNLQVVSTETNAEMLRDIPHQEMEDLSVVYRFVLQSDEQGTQSILITNHLLDVYGITAEQLHNDALKAAPINSPIEIAGMNEVIKEIMGTETLDDLEIPKEEVMYVASNPSKSMGAGIIAYPEFMDTASEKVKGDFYMIPSSLHEVLLVPDDGKMSRETLEEMLKDVNDTQVLPEERLSYNVYHYDSKEKIFEIAKKYEDRQQEVKFGKETSVLENLGQMKQECAARMPRPVMQEAFER